MSDINVCPACGNECDMMQDIEGNCRVSVCCDAVMLVRCPSCHGEGDVYEDDYECDWINYDHDFITCPECGGDGWVSELTWQ